jgi:membrane protease YdiL (CAAX protease family)
VDSPHPSAPASANDPRGGRLAAALRGFGPLGLLAILLVLAAEVVVQPLGAVLALLWARASRTPLRALGYVRPRSWLGGLAVGLAFGIAFKLVMKSVVMPLLGAPPVNPAYQHLVGNTAALPGMLFAVFVGAGFGEETLYRGYMFERLGRLLGTGTAARTATVLVTAAVFALAHVPGQGLFGALQAAIGGLVLGAIFAVTGELWLLMCTHVAFDLTAVAIIYWDLEVAVAHLLFK